jgi:molybdopterin molybdotransferase
MGIAPTTSSEFAMISTDEADRRIDDVFAGLPRRMEVERVALGDCLGRVLAGDVLADRDQPPFDRVAMDGIAVALADGYPAPDGVFQIRGSLSPGQRVDAASAGAASPYALEVMTGAALSPPWNTVVPWEDLEPSSGAERRLRAKAPLSPGLNIHRRGSDYRRGDLLLRSGTLLRAPHVHVLASVGCSAVPVLARPRLALVSTGDELVPVETAPGPEQIRMSNMPALAACLSRAGLPVGTTVHSADREDDLRRTLAAVLGASDVVFISGAVSKGSKDFVPAVLDSLGCSRVFHGVAHRPGKPMWFGTSPQGGVVFALPGNPVSSLVCFVRYALPHLRRWGQSPRPSQLPRDGVVLPLADAVKAHPGFTLLLPARVVERAGEIAAVQTEKSKGSGNYAGLLATDGIAELAAQDGMVPEGSPIRFFPWP